jgi:serine/threonine-protein kinase RsbW
VQSTAELKDPGPRPEKEIEQQGFLADNSTSEPARDARHRSVPTLWRREFEFLGVLASVPHYTRQVMEFVSAHCPDVGDEIDIFVAVQEALANAALHGCKDDPLKLIHCVLVADGASITITVRDPGPGFDVQLAEPENYQATRLSHGRGICLMRNLMSSVEFLHNGVEVVLTKRLKSAV